ncbi:MAG TPA: hypothetical protein VG942_17780 [Hyphomonadaceae bacterium]|nr:hypothetical protein [Hyphomonadaceae bacterium]
MKLAVISGCFLLAAGCAAKADDFASCAAKSHAFEVTDQFLEAFNRKDMGALEKTFHFPHIRIASYPLQVLTGPGQQDDVFGSLASEGWARSEWADRKIVQCSATKAHMVATFERLHPDGSVYARYDGLYIVELRDGFWGITARSTFAP